jgi:hypothetical protein
VKRVDRIDGGADMSAITPRGAEALRNAYLWGALFGGAFVLRTALDWLMPPVDFHTRATISTAVAATILTACGCWTAWRSGSLIAAALAGFATAALGALIAILGAAALLAVWHDPETMAAISRSGGLGEVFSLPIVTVLPGASLGAIGGVAGASMKRMLAS